MDSYVDELQLNAVPKYYQEKFLKKKKISDLAPETSKGVHSLLKITEEISEKTDLRIFDESEKDNLILVHYILPHPEIKHIRGIVFDISDKEQPKIIAESFPYTDEFLIKDDEEKQLPFEVDVTVHSITKAKEGTIIRVFKGPVTGEWYFSTHKKLDGKKSRWSGPTFGKIFEEAWGSFDEYPLDEYLKDDTCYVFLVCHPSNRLVCDIEGSKAKLVGTSKMKRDPIVEDDKFQNDDVRHFKKQHPKIKMQGIVSLKTNKEVIDFVKSSDWRVCSGVMIYNHHTGECCKLVNEVYQSKRELRGNEPNLRLRYLQLRSDPQKRNELLELFNDRKELFEETEKDFKRLPLYLSVLYRNRYKNGDRSIIPKEEYCLIEKTRRNYKPSTSLASNLRFFLESTNPLYVNSMIKNMKKEGKERLNANM